jgi:imidazolonepropionase-like amidohydrolase
MKAIIGANLIDGTGAEPLRDVTVLVDGGRILEVAPRVALTVPSGAEVIDGSGLTMLPGLIDCHDHLASFGYDVASRWGLTEPLSQRHMRIASVLRQTLESGYTTVRDAGGLEAGFRDAVSEGLVPGPRLLVSLAIISPTGGIGEHRSASGHLHPEHDSPTLPSGVADGPDAMRAKVREVVRAGADAIKFATTGGASSRPGLGPKDTLITREEIEAIVDEAHNLGRKVMCHALGGPGLRAAIEAGVDSIEHGSYLDEAPELLPVMRQKDITLVPTFSVYEFHATQGTPHGRQRSADLREHHVASMRMALDAGVRVAAGTDAGGWLHGNNAQEIVCLVKAGMTPAQAIQSATGRAAECLGIESEIGTVEKGKRADIILVAGNPLSDVSILERGESVRLVMKDGLVYKDCRA